MSDSTESIEDPADTATDDTTGDATADTGDTTGDALDLDAIERDLDDVQAALVRLDAGTYWLDEVSGEAIPDDVLVAHPTARTATASTAHA